MGGDTVLLFRHIKVARVVVNVIELRFRPLHGLYFPPCIGLGREVISDDGVICFQAVVTVEHT